MIQWLEDAVDDLQQLHRYIAEDDVMAADRIVKKILSTVLLLADQPNMGREGRVMYTRELIITGTTYIIPYRVKNKQIEILRVFHGRMQWPEVFKS